MPKDDDAAVKTLVDIREQDWIDFVLRHSGRLGRCTSRPLDTNLSSVVRQADEVHWLIPEGGTEADAEILNFEQQSSWDDSIVNRILVYSVLAGTKHQVPVHSVLILLDRRANSPQITGEYQLKKRDGTVYHHFSYQVIRIWELSADALLAGPIGTVPLAMLTDQAAANLAATAAKFRERRRQEGQPQELLAASYLLFGLRDDQLQIRELLKENTMWLKDSSTYQDILSEGRQEGLIRGQLGVIVD